VEGDGAALVTWLVCRLSGVGTVVCVGVEKGVSSCPRSGLDRLDAGRDMGTGREGGGITLLVATGLVLLLLG
jgi:hypothetical protein